MSSKRYKAKFIRGDEEVRNRMRELAVKHKRMGCPMMHMILKREGLVVNKKRSERLYYQEERLSLRRRRPKRKRATLRVSLDQANRMNHRWSMDFIFDGIYSGRRIKCLTIVDDYSRKAPFIAVDHSIGGEYLVRLLKDVRDIHGLPEEIRVDNGPEFQSRCFYEFCLEENIKLHFIRPGKPTENSYIESFNGKFRDECLNENVFLNLEDARDKIETWREFYNSMRPHSALKGLSPNEFIDRVCKESTA